jgi:hypothetical protein
MIKQLTTSKLLIVSVSILRFGIGGGGVWYMLSRPAIAQKYINQTNFPVYAAKTAAGFTLRKSSVNVSHPEQGTTLIKLSLVGKDNTVTLTEQAYPSIIIPDQFFAGINEYDTLSSNLGSIVLARPGNANTGHQVAVATPNNATMIFANPQKELSNNQWMQFFDALKVIK